MEITKEQILKIVDLCFHMYASDFRNEAKQEATDLINKHEQAINYAHSSQLLNACFEIGDKVIYDGEKAEIVFIDKNTGLLNLECTFDQTMIYGINRKYCTKSV